MAISRVEKEKMDVDSFPKNVKPGSCCCMMILSAVFWIVIVFIVMYACTFR